MIRFFKSFLSFTRKERLGIVALLLLIFLIFTASYIVRHYSNKPINIDEEKLNIAWQKTQAENNEIAIEKSNSIAAKELFYFDPNTLDSAGFISLGLKEKTVHYLLNWRRKGKHFYKKEDLKPLYSLSENDYHQLEPFIQIIAKENATNTYAKEQLPPLPKHINLNKTDSATLVRLKGIGPYLAQKIISYRNGLGGFLNHSQLLEIYKFHDTTFTYLKETLLIYPNEIRKININTATESDLQSHPYFDEKTSKNIVMLRKGLNKYENISQLRQVPLMNDEKYRKIAPYCTID